VQQPDEGEVVSTIWVPRTDTPLPGKMIVGAAGMTPEQYKDQLRRLHKADDRALKYQGFDRYKAACDIARSFWAVYERVNRDFLPDDPVYSVVRSGITPVAGSDYFTFVGAASRKARYLELIIGSEGTASAAARAVFQRSSGGTTGGGAQTPEKFDQLSPASGVYSNIFTTWSAQPTLSGNPQVVFAWNAFGGSQDWKAAPGEEITHTTTEQESFRNSAGTAVLSTTAIFEEQ
jgi:hypothetical protein